MSRATGRWSRIGTVAAEEYRRALEGRWLLGFSILLTALILGLSFFGLAQGREVGFQGFARVTLSLMNLVLLIVPLTGLMLGVASVANSTGALPLLLAQPVSRTEVFAGKFLGLAAALIVAQAVGFGAGGVTVSLGAGSDQIVGFAVLAGLSFLLGSITIAAALMLSALWPDRVRASSAALGLWLLMVVAYDLVVLGLTATLRGLPLQSLLLPAMLLNPVDLCRVLTTFAAGSGALFGPTSAVLVRFFGTSGGVAIALGILAAQLVVPLVIGAWIFRRRDW